MSGSNYERQQPDNRPQGPFGQLTVLFAYDPGKSVLRLCIRNILTITQKYANLGGCQLFELIRYSGGS
jgi:hypothetical protein